MLADKPFFLVLEEDGTTVETEEYFQSLADDTVFMVLHKGQKWQPPSQQVKSHLSLLVNLLLLLYSSSLTTPVLSSIPMGSSLFSLSLSQHLHRVSARWVVMLLF